MDYNKLSDSLIERIKTDNEEKFKNYNIYLHGFFSPGSLLVTLGLTPLTTAVETFVAADIFAVVLFDGVSGIGGASGPTKLGNSSAKAANPS